MGKDQGSLQQRAGGQCDSCRHQGWEMTGQAGKQESPWQRTARLKDPLKRTLTVYGKVSGVGHPIFPRLGLAKQTGIPLKPKSLGCSSLLPISSCHLSWARLGKPH